MRPALLDWIYLSPRFSSLPWIGASHYEVTTWQKMSNTWQMSISFQNLPRIWCLFTSVFSHLLQGIMQADAWHVKHSVRFAVVNQKLVSILPLHAAVPRIRNINTEILGNAIPSQQWMTGKLHLHGKLSIVGTSSLEHEVMLGAGYLQAMV